ncbi:MAG: ATP-binding cassette domain-containing protein [Candidatus Cloacimonetes bacterium]|nr:ATP-binding cassette domain-containing protein [Candidatus Cloacimonadota bacterium]
MIKLKNINLRFGNKVLFDNLNFHIKQNDKILISGKSGIGKTTLMQMILGFSEANSGKIFFKSEKIDRKNIWDIRNKISYVPQNIRFKHLKIELIFQNIFDLKHNKTISNWIEKLPKLLEFFELDEDILEKNWNDLSGGEKQRISLIIASLLNRKIFFLDEVTSALDESLKMKTINYFLEKEDSTILMISHDKSWCENNYIKNFDLEKQI